MNLLNQNSNSQEEIIWEGKTSKNLRRYVIHNVVLSLIFILIVVPSIHFNIYNDMILSVDLSVILAIDIFITVMIILNIYEEIRVKCKSYKESIYRITTEGIQIKRMHPNNKESTSLKFDNMKNYKIRNKKNGLDLIFYYTNEKNKNKKIKIPEIQISEEETISLLEKTIILKNPKGINR